jgi:hypothetical protein
VQMIPVGLMRFMVLNLTMSVSKMTFALG